MLDMKLLFVRLLMPILFIIILLSWSGITIATTASSDFDIFTVDSSPYGSPYSEWVAKWWTWWAGIPIDKHPVKDYSDPERCSVMQNGPVWFLQILFQVRARSTIIVMFHLVKPSCFQ